MPEQHDVTQDDIAGLIAVAEFLDALDLEGDAAEKLRELAAKLSRQVIVS